MGMLSRRFGVAWMVVLAGAVPVVFFLAIVFIRSFSKGNSKDQTSPPSSPSLVTLHSILQAPIPLSTNDITQEMKELAEWLEHSFRQQVELLELAARLRFHCGEIDKAEKIWRRAIEVDPQYPFAHHGVALALALKGEYEPAIREYRETLRLAPLALEPTLELGDLLIKSGKIDEAINLLENDFPATVESVWRYQMLGECYLHRGDLTQARVMYELALTLDPNNSGALYGLSVVLTREGQTAEAGQYAARLKEVGELERQKARDERKRFDDRENFSRKLADAYGKLAKFLLAANHLEEAEKTASRAIQLCADEPSARQVVAEIRLRRHAQPESKGALKDAALATDPSGNPHH